MITERSTSRIGHRNIVNDLFESKRVLFHSDVVKEYVAELAYGQGRR
jgi:hypothetical protein